MKTFTDARDVKHIFAAHTKKKRRNQKAICERPTSSADVNLFPDEKHKMQQPFKWTKRNNIQYSLMPLHLITKVFALTSYSTSPAHGKIKLRQSKIWMVYDACFFVIYLFVLQRGKNTSRFSGISDLYLGATVMALNVLASMANRTKIIKAQKRLMRIDVHLKKLSGAELNYKRPRILISAYILASSWISIVLEYFRCKALYPDYFSWATRLVPILVKNLCQTQFIGYVYLLHQRYRKLNSALKQTQVPGRTLKCKQIATLIATRKLHAGLCEVAKCINDAFSFQAMAMIGNDFVDIATWSYFCYVEFSKLLAEEGGASSATTVSLALCTTYKLLQIFILSLMCCRTTNEANATHRVIYKADILDASISTEVCIFGDQIAHWRFKFTAFDFFDIDMTLVYTVICAATMYLLIFIQLDLEN